MESKEQIIDEREALIEMYKAGFLDGYSCFHKPKKNKDWFNLNEAYKLAFVKRFEKRMKKVLKRCKEVKNNGRRKNK